MKRRNIKPRLGVLLDKWAKGHGMPMWWRLSPDAMKMLANAYRRGITVTP
jgi:hypothetical protein